MIMPGWSEHRAEGVRANIKYIYKEREREFSESVFDPAESYINKLYYTAGSVSHSEDCPDGVATDLPPVFTFATKVS